MILAEQQLDEARIAAFLVQKASARNIQVSKRAFREDEIRSRARENYADLQATVRKAFIPFEEAFSKIVGFTERLNIPD